MSSAGAMPAIVLAISAHDPTGAAGVQADIESIGACGCRCASLLTATTAQNTSAFAGVYPQAVEQLRAEARLLFEDLRFAACKIGMLGNAPTAGFVAELLADHPDIPIVLDPILAAGTGTRVADAAVLDCLKNRLMPLTTVVTPNCREAREIAGTEDLERAAEILLRLGAAHVLITGADEPTRSVINVLYSCTTPPVRYEFERLPHQYHGSGCTLAAAVAALLARGLPIARAVADAQAYTWNALRRGVKLGRGQLHPDRAAAGRTP